MGIFQRPGYGVVHGPGFPGGSVQEPEGPAIPSCEQTSWQEQRCGCGNSGLEKSASGGRGKHGHLRFSAEKWKRHRTASIVVAWGYRFFTTVPWGRLVGVVGGSYSSPGRDEATTIIR
jgi:hypothetical protein